ncbi:hypothetical protein BGW37DRAFT_472785 [Umbelopsis sp. PMI_123]|nr:hypothetical protein BGW37DRAFT_472785 [Umbelopsis sp. PMI_123]
MSEKKPKGFFSRLTGKKDKKDENGTSSSKVTNAIALRSPPQTPAPTPQNNRATAQSYAYNSIKPSPSSLSPPPPKHTVHYTPPVAPPLPLPLKDPITQENVTEIISERATTPYSYSYKPSIPKPQSSKPSTSYNTARSSTPASSASGNSRAVPNTARTRSDRPSTIIPSVVKGDDVSTSISGKIVELKDTGPTTEQGSSKGSTITPILSTNAKLLHPNPPEFSNHYTYMMQDGQSEFVVPDNNAPSDRSKQIILTTADLKNLGFDTPSTSSQAPEPNPITSSTPVMNVPEPPSLEVVSQKELDMRFEKIKRQLRNKSRGALEIFDIARTQTRIALDIFIDGLLPELAFPLRGLKDAFVHDHPSFKLITADLTLPIQLPNHPDHNIWVYVDEESCEQYQGILPGTQSHKSVCEVLTSKLNAKLFDTEADSGTYPLPAVTLKNVVDAFEHRKKVGISSSDVENYRELQKLIGDWAPMESIAPEMYTLDKQCQAIIKILNNAKYTYNICDNSSVSVLVNSKHRNIITIVYQCLLAFELLLRLPRASPSALVNLNAKVKADMMMAKRWMDNIEIYWKPNDESNHYFRSRIHTQQIDGLVKFAEELNWPYRDMAEKNLKEAWIFAQSGAVLNDHVWDWVHGACLPGQYYSIKAMTALMVLSPPEIKELGTAPYPHSGLMLTDRTYWRTSSILGSILGGMKGVKSSLHWVGPCVPVIEGVEIVAQWVSVTSRHLAYPKVNDTNVNSKSILPYDMNDLTTKDFETRLRRMELSDNWINPHPPPPKSPEDGGDKIEIQGIKLHKYTAFICKGPYEEFYAYYASLLIRLNDKLITFQLIYNPMLICTHPCIGVHERHRSQLRYTIVEASALQNSPRFDHTLIVNVQGSHEADVMARAWCFQQGRHAVIKIPQTCFCCAWEYARSIDVQVIIYQ